MAVKGPVQVSQKIILPLSALMMAAALLSFVNHDGVLNSGTTPRLFTTSRVPVRSSLSGSLAAKTIKPHRSLGSKELCQHRVQTGKHLLTSRQQKAPMWVYRGLHAVPAIIWSIGMPLQHVDGSRKKWPVLHRTAGYVLLSLSLLLSITGYWFFLSKNAYSHHDFFHMHSSNGMSPAPWPTFAFSTWLLAPFYWLTMYKTTTTARAKNFVQHRKWAVLHTIFACVIAAERLGLVTLYAIGFALTLLPPAVVHDFFRVGYTVEEMAEAEMSVFAVANVLALGFVLAWLCYEFGRAGYFAAAEDGDASVTGKKTRLKRAKLL